MAFIERHGLWSDDQARQAAAVVRRVEMEGIRRIRLSFADQHGELRGKTVTAGALPGVMRDGLGMVITLIAKDTAHRTAYPIWGAAEEGAFAPLAGGGDMIMVPDPASFRVLPWAEATGWLQCDLYGSDGAPLLFDTRRLCRDALADLTAAGYGYRSGIEVEFHLFRLLEEPSSPADATQPGTPPRVALLNTGYQHLTEQRLDGADAYLAPLAEDLEALGLPLRSIETEFGPSQFEITLDAMDGLAGADAMVLLRAAVKQSARRRGLHASFMCRPGLGNLFSSGWHLHQSLLDGQGRNAFVPDRMDGGTDHGADQLLSTTGRHFVAGLLAHAGAACVFTTPTINGYKRFQPHSLAPDHVNWGRDNRGVMVRVVGDAADGSTHIENRVGEPAANPYLYVASQIISGMAGLTAAAEPPEPADTPYGMVAPRLPGSLAAALDALRTDVVFRDRLGADFIRYITMIKDAEVHRFMAAVTDWEHREYFAIY